MFVARNEPSPSRKPSTIPSSLAFSCKTAFSICSSSRAINAYSLEMIQEIAILLHLCPRPHYGQPDPDGEVPQKRKTPAQNKAGDKPPKQANESSRPRHGIVQKELTQKSQVGSHNLAALQQQNSGRQEDNTAQHDSTGHSHSRLVQRGKSSQHSSGERLVLVGGHPILHHRSYDLEWLPRFYAEFLFHFHGQGSSICLVAPARGRKLRTDEMNHRA